jgi:hypothetical protein
MTLREDIGFYDDTLALSRKDATKESILRSEEQILRLKNEILTESSGAELESDPEITSGNFDRLQIIEACKIDLNFFAAISIPDTFVYPFPATHITAWQILIDGEQDSEHKFLQFAIGIPRGHAKTTLLKLFVLRCILFTNRSFFLITCSTEQHAINFISDIELMLNNSNIKAIFGDWRLGLETNTRGFKKFGFNGRSITIFGIGAEGSVRGINVGNSRPDVIVMDDIQTKECADSILMSKALLEWMVGTLMKAKSPKGCMFIFAGNMFAARGSILRQLKTNPTWIKFISGAILADGRALWPEHRSLESLIEELNNDIAMGQAHIFFSEVLNDTNAGINSTVDYSKFPIWPWSKEDLPQGKFLLIDPSQGKGKDADVIVTVEVYDSKVGIRAVHEDYYSPANLIRKALIIAIQSEIYCIAIEAMAYQSTLIFWFEQICQDIGISGISFVPIYTNSYSKNSRISSAIKAMQTREIYLHDSIRSVVQRQIADWNPLKRDNKDDILDAISNAPKVVAEYTYDIMCKSNLLVLEANKAEVVEFNSCF